MGIHQTQRPIHWNYFLSLEDDLSQIARYIELTEKNYKTFSLELTRVLFAASSEVDVVCKLLCSRLGSIAKNINTCRNTINNAHPNFYNIEVLIPRYGLSLKPWSKWVGAENPLWWRANNGVKHQRDTNYEKANLKNALNSVAGLFVLLLYYYRQEAENGNLRPNPSMLQVGAPFNLEQTVWDHDITLTYTFND